MKRRIVVAVSGGVDSSVAAYLLKQYSDHADLIGLHMSNWNASDEDIPGRTSFCVQSEKDANDAQLVCDHLKIRMQRVSFAAEYWTGVFEPFLHGLEKGLMPNPDVGCNSRVKFGAMRQYAMNTLKADFIATGHYAQLWHRSSPQNDEDVSIICKGSRDPPEALVNALNCEPESQWIFDWGYGQSVPLLLAGADATKDQSYFLAGVKGESLRNVLFPIGHLFKNTTPRAHDPTLVFTRDEKTVASRDLPVRSIATLASIPTAQKKDSMGICFIGKRNFTDFIHGYLPPSTKTGTYIDIDSGAIVGQYHSPSYLTIGQGAKISGASCKWFVAKVDKSQDVIYVCSDTHHPSLYSSELYVKLDDFNWIGGEIPLPLVCGKDMPALCRIRHLQPLITSNIIWDRKNHLLVLHFHNAVRAITPGQTVVIYAAKGIVCLGGGTIWKAGPTFLERNSTLPSVLHPSGHNDLSLKHFHNFKIRT